MKVTKELKDKLVRIKAELENELASEKIGVQECDGVELTVDYFVRLFFQEPEWCEEVEPDDVESYDNLNVSLSVSFECYLDENKKDWIKSKLSEKLEGNKLIAYQEEDCGMDDAGYETFCFDVEAEGEPEIKPLIDFLDFIKKTHKLNSKTASVNRAADVIGVKPLTIWRWLDSKPVPPAPISLLLNLIMERGTTKNLPR